MSLSIADPQVWNPENVGLYATETQRLKRGSADGLVIFAELATHAVYSDVVMHHLLRPENAALIPEWWKGRLVYFWGRLFRIAGKRCVKFMFYSGTEWTWDRRSLDLGFDRTHLAAVEKSIANIEFLEQPLAA